MEVLRKVIGIPRKSSLENSGPPKNIGIKGFEFYFPKNYVDLADLEKASLDFFNFIETFFSMTTKLENIPKAVAKKKCLFAPIVKILFRWR